MSQLCKKSDVVQNADDHENDVIAVHFSDVCVNLIGNGVIHTANI